MSFKIQKFLFVRFVLLLALLGGMVGTSNLRASAQGTDPKTTVLVVSTTGVPLAGKPVYAFNGTTYTGYNKVTDANGEAVLTLPEGTYRFRVDVDGTQFWSGPENHCYNCQSVMVSIPEPVAITVQDADGTRISGLNVYAFNGTTYTGFHGVTDGDGQLRLRLPEGSYRFRADRNGTQFWSGAANHCDVPSCESAGVTVSKPMAVTVLDTDGAPKAGLNVYAFNGSTYTGYHKITDTNGQAAFTLPLGSYRFRADLNGTQFWSGASNHCTLPGCDSVQVTVTIPVTVLIRDAGGTSKVGLNVYAFNGSTYTGYHKVSDAGGQAIFTLPLGNYRFRADEAGIQYWSGSASHCSLPGCLSAAITVGPAATATVQPTDTATPLPTDTPTPVPTDTPLPTNTSTPPPTSTGPVTRIVTNPNDSGTGSLRQAILEASSGDTIKFSPSLAGQTVTLASDLTIVASVVIDGSGLSPQVTISGGNVAHLRVPALNRVTIYDLTIANGHSAYGGAIESLGYLMIRNSTFRNNVATTAGGAILSAGGLILMNSTIDHNQAGSGGALLIDGNSNVVMLNSTITQNQASSGGALYMNGGGSLAILNSTIAGNNATRGAEYFINGGVTANFYNTVFACTLTNESNCYFENGTVVSPHNSVIAIGPLSGLGLSELGNNGGPTWTMALLPGSSLIDAGDDGICAEQWIGNLDQRGVRRPQGAHCDIGAYEYDGFAAPTTTNLAISPNPSEPGQTVTATAMVSSASGTPTGIVDFSVDGSVLCTRTLANGTATCDLIFNSTRTLAAIYHPANAYYEASTASVVQTVGKSSTTLALAHGPNPSLPGERVDIYVMVNNLYGGSTPTGTVTVSSLDGNCTITLSNGEGNCSITFTTLGASTATLIYSGDTDHLANTWTFSHEVIASVPTPTNTPTQTPAPGPTPVLSCNSIAANTGTIKLSGKTMYLTIPNPNPYPVTIGSVSVAWNYAAGHIPGNSTLWLQKADLNGTAFWTGNLNQPSAFLPLSTTVVLPANTTSKLTFTFDKTYTTASGAEQIQIQFSTLGCEAYPILRP